MRQQTDPQKPPYFYLSYAQAEDKSKVEQFFNDLSDSVRIRAGLPLDETVGCCENGDREAGLRTSRVMIALLSLPYFKDKTAGREWQIFEMRKALTESNDTQVIIPVRWLSYSGATPVVINQTPIFNGNGHEPVANMLRSPVKQRDYAELVNKLADYIVDLTASFELREIDSIPDDILNAFESIEEPPIDPEPINPVPKILNQNLLIIDGAFAKSVVEQIKETPDAPPPLSTKTTKETYSVFVIDDEPEDVKRIKNTGDFSREFNVTIYEDAARLIRDVDRLSKERQEPDLVVVNPELPDPGTQQPDLIYALLGTKAPSAILALSQNPEAESSLESAGINDLVGILQKPFSSAELLPPMRRWAELGRDKRYRRGRSEKRRAFLSYASPDEKMASKICKWLELREIGVWYSVTTMKPGDPWKDKVAQGLEEADVFMPLISDSYPLSEFCHPELGIILDRLERGIGNRLVIPILYNDPVAALKDSQIKHCRNQHEIKISDHEWLDGFKLLLRTVQSFLGRGRP